MSDQHEVLAEKEHADKMRQADKIRQYYTDKAAELGLADFARIQAYLDEALPEAQKSYLLHRGIVFAHMGFEPFTTFIADGKPFAVVSGLNPSAPLHLGHKVMFDILLFLQKLGADIYIPLTNDESYLDGKAASLAESRKMAYEKIIPSIMAFGFDPKKTHIFVLSDYPEIYNFAMQISKHVTNKYVATVFGENSLDNAGKAFYRSAVQLAQILLPQLPEFGGSRSTLIPVGIDQHPYILLARDAAKKLGFTPPSELIFKFQNSLLDPVNKMSGSRPKTAIYLDDTPGVIAKKIQRAYTGAVSSLDVHKKLGAVPDACSVFSLLYFHHPDNDFVDDIRKRYENGGITTKELKDITTDFITKIVLDHQNKAKSVNRTDAFILRTPLGSLLV